MPPVTKISPNAPIDDTRKKHPLSLGFRNPFGSKRAVQADNSTTKRELVLAPPNKLKQLSPKERYEQAQRRVECLFEGGLINRTKYKEKDQQQVYSRMNTSVKELSYIYESLVELYYSLQALLTEPQTNEDLIRIHYYIRDIRAELGANNSLEGTLKEAFNQIDLDDEELAHQIDDDRRRLLEEYKGIRDACALDVLTLHKACVDAAPLALLRDGFSKEDVYLTHEEELLPALKLQIELFKNLISKGKKEEGADPRAMALRAQFETESTKQLPSPLLGLIIEYVLSESFEDVEFISAHEGVEFADLPPNPKPDTDADMS